MLARNTMPEARFDAPSRLARAHYIYGIWLSTTINICRSRRRTSVVIEMQIYDSASFIYDVPASFRENIWFWHKFVRRTTEPIS